jgi:hypothetical protein
MKASSARLYAPLNLYVTRLTDARTVLKTTAWGMQ